MKPLAWILFGALVTAAGTPWLGSLRGPEDVRTDDGPPGATPAAVGEDPAPAGRVPAGDPGAAAPALAPHVELVRELRMILGTGRPEDRVRERELIEQLVADASEPAIEAVIEALEDPRSVFAGRASRSMSLQQLFAPLGEQPPVYHLARREVERLGAVRAGEDYAVAHATHWYVLAGRHGGALGRKFVVEHLTGLDPVLGKAAAQAAGQFPAGAGRDGVVTLLLAGGGLSPEVVNALALMLTAQKDPELRAELFEAALEPGAPVERRAALLFGLGRFLDPDTLPRYLLLYRMTDDAQLQDGVIAGLCNLEVSETLPEPVVDLTVEPFALELIGDPDGLVATRGARLAQKVEALHDGLMLKGALQQRLEQGASHGLTAALKAALQAFE